MEFDRAIVSASVARLRSHGSLYAKSRRSLCRGSLTVNGMASAAGDRHLEGFTLHLPGPTELGSAAISGMPGCSRNACTAVKTRLPAHFSFSVLARCDCGNVLVIFCAACSRRPFVRHGPDHLQQGQRSLPGTAAGTIEMPHVDHAGVKNHDRRHRMSGFFQLLQFGDDVGVGHRVNCKRKSCGEPAA